MVASDRFSAFDCVFDQAFRSADQTLAKGVLLTSITKKWFDLLPDTVRHHYAVAEEQRMLAGIDPQLQPRCMVVEKLTPIPLEAVVRANLVGTAWKEYQDNGSVSGMPLPPGMKKYDPLPQPLFTPAKKAPPGESDSNCTAEEAATLIGADRVAAIKDLSMRLFQFAQSYCRKRGVLLLDTKFEFGLDGNNALVVIDEIITPDSSRFILQADQEQGVRRHYDKQYLRDYLVAQQFQPPEPGQPQKKISFPHAVIDELLKRYHALEQRLFDST